MIKEMNDTRFIKKIIHDGGCWIWTACKGADGYGQYWNGSKMVRAHRHAYEAIIGAIPAKHVLDHLCRRPLCVNPAHLEPVTNKVNLERGVHANRSKTHCKQGHQFLGSNLYIDPTGHRRCQVCARTSRNKQPTPKGGSI